MMKKSSILFVALAGILLGTSAAQGAELSLVKNTEYLGEFFPQKVYEIERTAGKFAIVSSEEAMKSLDGKTELVAVGTDEGDSDFFVFRATCEKGEDECEKKFEEYILNFSE